MGMLPGTTQMFPGYEKPRVPSAWGQQHLTSRDGHLGFITNVRNGDKEEGGQLSPGYMRDSLLLQGLSHPNAQDNHELLPHLGFYFLKSISAGL